jgi:acyl-coenzyme A thioesterase PaaI-like protein
MQIADSAAAWAIYGSNDFGDVPVTVETKINLFKPVKSYKLVADEKILKSSRIFACDVELKNGKVARALI